MIELYFAVIFALLALFFALVKMPAWLRSGVVLNRLRIDTEERDAAKATHDEAVKSGLIGRLLSSALIKGDYNEMLPYLRVTGKPVADLQVQYLLVCWFLPVVAAVLGTIFFGPLGAFFGAVLFFIGSRRYLRTVGARAKNQQNLEAIELAQVLKMLLEAGLSIERAFRISAIQARPLIPTLVYRLDRFNRLMDSGADRGVALDDIGGDKDIPVLYNLTRLLKQSGSLGGAITGSISQVIEEAHKIQQSRVQEQVNKLGAKMTLVMMGLMLPALFIIIGGPAGMNIVQALSQ